MRFLLNKVISLAWKEEVIPTIEVDSKTMRLVVGALLGAIAVILQSAGIFTGIGYILSMMATAPIVLASLVSLRIGVMTYSLTAMLLAILQPSELLVFLFTTGILGIGLGFGFKYVKKNILIIIVAAACLTFGISALLYGFNFAILGPSVSSQVSSMVILLTFVFSLLYSWIWKRVSISTFKALIKIISK